MRNLECLGQAYELLRLKGSSNIGNYKHVLFSSLSPAEAAASSTVGVGVGSRGWWSAFERQGWGGWLQGPLTQNADMSLTPIFNLLWYLHL